MTIRRVVALLALANAFVATYLHLWKRGLTGPLACGAARGCEIAQRSSYGWFLGVDVALIGAVGYLLILATALLGTRAKAADDPRWSVALMALVYPALLFTVRLKYGEFVVLRTFCPWCAVSAVTITLFSVLVWLDLRRARRAAAG